MENKKNFTSYRKPYVARTSDGDYYFSNKEEAQAFALARSGFFDTQKNISCSNKAKNLNKGRIL